MLSLLTSTLVAISAKESKNSLSTLVAVLMYIIVRIGMKKCMGDKID